MTDYRVVRSRRRTVALQVDQSGSVIVRAPMTLPEEEIRTFVEKHETWIHRQQQRQVRYRAEHPEPTPQEQEALRQQAKTLLPQRVAYWAGVMGVRPTGIRITSARTRFGSCSGKNSLCFSLYLMAYPPEAIEYVVVHELAHIRHKNHSPAFYAEDLCARYFTYRRGGQTHFVLFDDAGTLRRKIEMGQALGIREGFVMLPEVEDLTGSLFTGEG